MSKECSIVKDLIPLYLDQVCSQESTEFVEEHIKSCTACREELKKNQVEYQALSAVGEKGETETMKKIAMNWKKDKSISFLKGIFFTTLISAIACPIMFSILGSEVLEDGTLSEPFLLIPLMYLFLFCSIISGSTLLIKAIKRKRRLLCK